MAFFIKQNDTSPILQANLKDGNNAAVDVSGASIAFKMRPVSSSAVSGESSFDERSRFSSKGVSFWQNSS